MKDLFLRKELKQPASKELHKLVKRVEQLKKTLLELEQTTANEPESNESALELPLEEPILMEEEPEYIVLKSPKQKQNTHTASLEQEAIATVTKNKKHIIKQKIIGVISKNKVTTKQLKEIIVDKHRYCSKATYYRYVHELKAENLLESIIVNQKEYLYGIQKEYHI